MTVDEQFQRVLDVTDRFRDEIGRHVRSAVEELAVAARSEVLAGEPEADGRLVKAIRSIDGARSLSEILDALANCSGREASRVAILLVTGARYRGWRFIGFGPSFGAADGIEFGVHEAGVIAEAARATAVTAGDGVGDREAPAFAELPAGRVCFAVPISIAGQIVAMLYADQGPHSEFPIPNPDRLEVFARQAGSCLAALTALKAAPVLTGHTELSNRQAPLDQIADDRRGDEDAAQRYARLLISEIKLYHEGEVVAGQRGHDLATRLGGEIARARVLYEQGVPPDVRQRSDHFHAELVRTLANGDESLLELGTSGVRSHK
jgi:hypothetical protein